jgi:hypothetical protein
MRRIARWLLLGATAAWSPYCLATLLSFGATLTGPAEFPPNASPGTGDATVTIDTVAHLMTVHAAFSGLLGTTTASHIHCCTALPGVGTAPVATQTPTFFGFPLGVTAGTYDNTFDLLDMATYNAPFVAANGGTAVGAEAALIAGLLAGVAYFNIHSTAFPGGEIRGFLAVSEPATLAVAALGLVALAWIRRRAV